jgi:HEAT repeat protein
MRNRDVNTGRAGDKVRPTTTLAVACVWLTCGSGLFLGELRAANVPASPATRENLARGTLAQGERSPVANPRDIAARERFLAVEKFARLPADQQARGFPDFYHQQAPFFMNAILEGILSSYPSNILDRRTYAHPGGDAKTLWAAQLTAAAARLTPDEVADKLGIPLWLNVAGRARTVQLMKQHANALAPLLAEDLASPELTAVQRACKVIGDLQLRQFTDKVLALYLVDTPLSAPAQSALVWLADPATVRPLLAQIEKDPKRIVRHAGLFQGPLAGKPAEPVLVKLLDSPDAEVRYHAASALSECRDASLAKPIARLAGDADPRLQSAALRLAMRLPDDAFASIHDDLAPLLGAKDEAVCLEAITCFARRKDPLAGPPILRLMRRDSIDPGQAVTVMQALNALAGESFGYNMHSWGTRGNFKALRQFETWLRGGGGR